MGLLRVLGLILAVSLFVLLTLRAAAIAVVMPYGVWLLLRDGGYPVWAQMSGFAIVVALISYRIHRAITVDRRRGY